MAKPLTSDQIMARIIAWQSDPTRNTMTCGRNSDHPSLEPRHENDKVILVCILPDCGYKQTHIPNAILTYVPPTARKRPAPLL